MLKLYCGNSPVCIHNFSVSEKEFIDIIGRDISQMPVNIIEDFKQLLLSACYTPGDFVESDHTLQCDDKSCTIGQ